MCDTEDLNTTQQTGRIHGNPEGLMLPDGPAYAFKLVVGKKTKLPPGWKVSTFKVVISGAAYRKHGEEVFAGAAVLVQGELEQVVHFDGKKPVFEVRIQARFIKPLGGL